MGETGRVIEVDDTMVTVLMERTEACAKCGACTMGMTSKEMRVSAKNLCGAKAGDWVNIELDGNDFLHAVLIMYGLPLVFLLAGFWAGHGLGAVLLPDAKELVGFLSGLCAMLISYWVINHGESSYQTKSGPGRERFMPRATKIVAGEKEE